MYKIVQGDRKDDYRVPIGMQSDYDADSIESAIESANRFCMDSYGITLQWEDMEVDNSGMFPVHARAYGIDEGSYLEIEVRSGYPVFPS